MKVKDNFREKSLDRRLAKVEAEGSSPFTRSIKKSQKIRKHREKGLEIGSFTAIPACVWIGGFPYFFPKITQDSRPGREKGVKKSRLRKAA